MITFSFILTEKCNWDCEYCAFPLLDNPCQITSDQIVMHMIYIKNIIDRVGIVSNRLPMIEIQGGELGLIPAGILLWFLKALDHKVSVSTNGLFLEKEYHLMPQIRPYIQNILWHVYDKPGAYSVPDFRDKDMDIIRGIVHNNVTDMINFIRYNDHITFDYIEMEYDIQKYRTCSTDDYRELWRGIEHLQNVTDVAKKRIRDRFDEMPNVRERCKDYHSCVSINLANETICLCQRAPEINIPLTEKNLDMVVKGFPKDIFKGISRGCNSCTRLYVEKHKRGIEKKVLLRRKLK